MKTENQRQRTEGGGQKTENRRRFLAGFLLCAVAAACMAQSTVIRKLKDLADVKLPAAPTDGHVLTYLDSVTGWTNQAGAAASVPTFNNNQFGSAGGTTNIKSGALLTNVTLKGGASSAIIKTNGGGILSVFHSDNSTELLATSSPGSGLLYFNPVSAQVNLGANEESSWSTLWATNIRSESLTSGRVVVTSTLSKLLVSSSVTTQELAYVSGVTSAIQTQLDAKPSSRVGVYRTVWIDAGAMVSSSTNGMATGSYTPSGSDNMTADAYDADDTTSESVQFKWAMPDEWDRGTVKVKFYMVSTNSSGAAVFNLAGGAASHDDAFGAILGTAQQSTNTVTAANDLSVSAATAAITMAGTPALGDLLILKLSRLPGDDGDTLGGDARLLGLQLQYTESTTEPSAW